MRKLAIILALSSTMLATPALARDGAWYVGGELGAMIVEDVQLDIGTVQDAIAIDHDYGYDAALFAGYDLGAFRLEAEVAYKDADIERFSNSSGGTLPGGAPTGFSGAGAGSTNALSFMVNGMADFGDDDGVNGFVGGGLGIARVEFDNLRAFANQGAFLDDSDSGFAWQVIAGIRAPVTDAIDVQLKYRFFNVDDVGTSGFNGLDNEARFRSHSLLGGIIFNFGGEEPAPEPLPAPPPPPPPPPAPPPMEQPAPEPVAVGPFIIFFDWDKDEITPQAAAILDNAASAYQQTGQAQVVLAGHADKSGSASYNVGLSQRRADNTRSYLAGRGVADGAITTEAFGESRPLVETADGVREPQNRRVEITFGPGSGQ